MLPLFQALRHESGNKSASFAPGDPTRQEFVIPRVCVSYVCANGQFDRTRLKLLGGSRAADPTRVLLARMLGNRPLLVTWTPGKQLAHAPRELLDVLGIELLTPFGGTLANQLPGLGIRQTFLFRPCERRFLYQHTLPLVPLPRTAETDDDGTEGRIPARSSRERRIATRQEHEMIEIRTREAQRPFRFQSEEAPLAKLFATLFADRVSDDPKHDDLTWWRDAVDHRRPRDRGLRSHC